MLILFGLPGGGKSYAGQLLRDHFGYFFHEADDDIPEDYRRDVAAGQVVDDDRRDAYHRHLLDRLSELRAAHPRLAVAVPLLRDRHRLWIRARFPEAVFILVVCEPAAWQARLESRRAHNVGLDYAQKIVSLYEPPTIPHVTLDDSAQGATHLAQQLTVILKRESERPPD
jgi:gluconate kinase